MKEAIWSWLTFGAPIARDLVSIGLATLGSYLAWLAIKMGREQGQTAKRQAEIAEKQHQIEMEQLSRKAVLSFQRSVSRSAFANLEERIHLQEYTIGIVNTGTRPARDVYWAVCAPWVWDCKPVLTAMPGSEDVKDDEFIDERGERFPALTGRCSGPIYPGERLDTVTISVEIPNEIFQEHRLTHCEYYLASEDGRVPTEGMTKLDLRMIVAFTKQDLCGEQDARESAKDELDVERRP